MAKFLAVYTGQPGAGGPPDPATIAKGMQAWTDWMTRHAGQVVDSGGPLGKTKRVSKAGIADASNQMSGFVVVEAADIEAAAKMFVDHPHFAIFPGDGVDIMPVMAIPTG